MSSFTVNDLPLAGLKLVERQPIGDSCGFLSRLFCAEELAAADPGRLVHGFQALMADEELLYCHSAAYTATAEAGLNAQEPMLAISWPLQITKLSARDARHPMLNQQFAGVAL
jgi:dTDP-4-dehydrorhamnose 3,5-epimerase